MTYAERLKAMRTVRGFTQQELAEAATTSASFVSHMETGKLLPSPELRARLRKALDWTERDDEAFAILGRKAEPA